MKEGHMRFVNLSRAFARCIIAGFVFAIALSQSGYAQSDPIVGTWSLNAARSTFPPGQALRSQTVTFQGTGANKTATVEAVDAQGKATRVVLLHIYDGQPHPTAGSPDADASAYTRIDANTIILTRMKAGKLAGVGSLVVSPDGRTLTVSGTGASGTGQQGNYVLIMDKQ
jgi:hypothetical protein